MSNSVIKHVFPGGNTTAGFYSFYDYILPQEEANHIFCIKGGPGVGKSSFMKKIGKWFSELGYDLEYHHCSSDPNSLDGIVIKNINVALIDGTSPHIVDPKNPGAVDEIINLGEFWDNAGMKKNKQEIIKTNLEIKRLFSKAYQYLKAAKEIYETYALTEGKAFDSDKYNVIIDNTLNKIFSGCGIKEKAGKERHLFGYALTPLGIVDYRDSIVDKFSTRYVISETPGASSEKLMNEILNEAVKKGLYVECYHSPIKIAKIEDILLPDLNISISVDNNYHHVSFEHDNEINLRELLDKNILEVYNDEINEDKEIFEMLMYKALNYINKAKAKHDKLEEYYIPNMNFSGIDLLSEKIIEKIKALI